LVIRQQNRGFRMKARARATRAALRRRVGRVVAAAVTEADGVEQKAGALGGHTAGLASQFAGSRTFSSAVSVGIRW